VVNFPCKKWNFIPSIQVCFQIFFCTCAQENFSLAQAYVTKKIAKEGAFIKSPTPLFLLLLFTSGIYWGLSAFFPAWRNNGRKKRKLITKTKGILYIFVCLPGSIFAAYIVYVFCGGKNNILPLTDEQLFRTADILMLAVIVVPMLIGAILGKKKKHED